MNQAGITKTLKRYEKVKDQGMTNQNLMASSVFEDGISFILSERYDLSRNSLSDHVRHLANKSQYTLDHWLGICKRCALVGDPMPWEDII